jgi:hypothetical protein
MRNNLASLQRLLYRLITDPEGVEAALDAERALPWGGIGSLIRGDERLSPVDRLRIYADAYFYRLLGVLREDYPATVAVIGDDQFRDVVRAYLAEYPPSRPSISYAGEFLADFLRRHAIARRYPFIADLARLERVLIEVFHGPDASSLSEAQLRAIPPARWPSIRLRAHPAAQVVDVGWRVGEIRRMVDEGKQWCAPAARASRILVWRQNGVTYYRELEGGVESGALDLLLKGATFAALCEAIAAECAGDAVAEVNRLTRRWLADGLLVPFQRFGSNVSGLPRGTR